MDGVEWKRAKWSKMIQMWFYINERAAAWAGKALIADHPVIAARLRSLVNPKKVTMVPYSSFEASSHDPEHVRRLGLREHDYWYTACRIEPENNVLEVVRAFSSKPRLSTLVILGVLSKDNGYHQKIRSAASNAVVFVPPVYDRDLLRSLRYFARGYVHGHSVGGTNPSLVEALAAGNAVLAHDNEFNRWTAGEDQCFFRNEKEAADLFTRLDADEKLRASNATAARARFNAEFGYEEVMNGYLNVFRVFVPRLGESKRSQRLAGTNRTASDSALHE
jgi:glycosyltransferase involved in cell wall biosynthesis